MSNTQTRQKLPSRFPFSEHWLNCTDSFYVIEKNKWARQSFRSWPDGQAEHETSSNLRTQKDDLGSDGGESESGHQTVIRFYWIKAGGKVSRQTECREEMDGGENGRYKGMDV